MKTTGDVYGRYLVRVAEVRQSISICNQALKRITPVGEYAVADPRITPPPKDRDRGFWESRLQLAADAIHRYESLDVPARWRLIGRLIGIVTERDYLRFAVKAIEMHD